MLISNSPFKQALAAAAADDAADDVLSAGVRKAHLLMIASTSTWMGLLSVSK